MIGLGLVNMYTHRRPAMLEDNSAACLQGVRTDCYDLAMPSFDAPTVVLLILTGAVSGFFNVTAGGGSFLSVPILMMLGMPAASANGTNRIALIVQNLTAIGQFRHGGVTGWRASWPLLAIALPGALLGAWAAVIIPEQAFRRTLAGLLVAVSALTLIAPRAGTIEPTPNHRYRSLTVAAFFALGGYAGFIQAGVGFLIVFALTGLERFSLVRAHAYKILLVLLVQLAALPVFVLHEAVVWREAVVLACAFAAGGWVGARVVLTASDRVLRMVFAAIAIVVAIGLVLV
jgi:uncharacterized membrane protein YfcA